MTDQQVAAGEHYKEKGNTAYKLGDVAEAIDAYKHALDVLPDEEAVVRKACLGNLAACYLKLKQWQECVEVCTRAIGIDPDYVKALQRRAAANEQIERWSALESALADYQHLATLLPSDPTYRRSITNLEPRIKVQQEKDKQELMDMGRKAGNTVLGWFGMSMDDIKFEQQPGGGYGVKLQR